MKKKNCEEFVQAYKAYHGEKVLLDVRNADEVAHGKLSGAVHIPLPELPQRLQELPKHAAVFIYCRSGRRAEQAAALLLQQGFSNCHVASEGGFEQLVALALPVRS